MTPVPVSLSPPVLLSRLREHLAETRRVAEAAQGDGLTRWYEPDEMRRHLRAGLPGLSYDEIAHDAAHIAKHDPASVLRQVTAWEARAGRLRGDAGVGDDYEIRREVPDVSGQGVETHQRDEAVRTFDRPVSQERDAAERTIAAALAAAHNASHPTGPRATADSCFAAASWLWEWGWRSPDEVARLVADAERENEQLCALLREVRERAEERGLYARALRELIDNAGIDLGPRP